MAYNYAENQPMPVCHDPAEMPVKSRQMQIGDDTEYSRGTDMGSHVNNPKPKGESY